MDLNILRHSCSHIMAAAVKQLWPEVKLGIGPAIEDGFYYDFDRGESFSEKELAQIESKMREIIEKDEKFVKEDISLSAAKELFSSMDEKYKVDLLEKITGDKVSLYRTGEGFVDLCRGPHIESTEKIKAFKLLSVAGAYWHGIETNPMLQRIYGICFETKDELDAYLKNLEVERYRDHRDLMDESDVSATRRSTDQEVFP